MKNVCEVIPLICFLSPLYGIRALFSPTSSPLIFFSFSSLLLQWPPQPLPLLLLMPPSRSPPDSHQPIIPLGMHSLNPSFWLQPIWLY